MVLEFQGVSLDEVQLASLLRTEEEGTRLDNVELLMMVPGVKDITLARLTLDQLEASIADGLDIYTGGASPRFTPLWPSALTTQPSYVNDPFFADAPRSVSRHDFEQAWREVDNWAAIIRA